MASWWDEIVPRARGAQLAGALWLLGCDAQVIVGYVGERLAQDAATSFADAGHDAGRDAGFDAGFDAGHDAALPPPPVTWPTGAHASNELPGIRDFESFRERPMDVAVVFVDRVIGWPGLVEPGWPVDGLDGYEGRLVLAEPLYPEGMGNNQDCADGMYDVEWQKLGPFLAARGRGDAILRLGWGVNDSEHPWRADADPTAWKACFRSVVEALRSTGPELEILWDFNPQGRPDDSGLDPYSAYPGDDVVDYIAIEHFDRYPTALDDTAWDAKCNAPTGLCSVIAFARAHGKRLGLAEWGVASCAEGGGDNPFFVRKTFELFAANADVVAFEAYYQDSVELCSVLTGDDTPNPESAAEYQRLYGPR